MPAPTFLASKLPLLMGLALLSAALPSLAAEPAGSAGHKTAGKLAIGTLSAAAPFNRQAQVRELLVDSLARLEKRKTLKVAGESIRYRPELIRFYAARDQRPAWVVSGRHALPAAWGLLDAVQKSPLEGFDEREYHARTLDSLLGPFGRRFRWARGPGPEKAADLELLLTDAYLKLASHMLDGRIPPLAISDRWPARPDKVDLAAHLNETLERGIEVQESLRNLAPEDPGYGVMKYWLARYQDLADEGGWKPVPAAAPPGSEAAEERAVGLCFRLALEGELDEEACEDDLDTAELARGLRGFQGRHGLTATGRLDESTRSELNVPVQHRIRQIRLNLEGWRWLPRELGEKHVRVNIADCSLSAWEDGRPTLSMRVVVGRKEDSTPVISDRIVSVFLNPPWNVPETIAGEEILPQLQKDPTYLEREGMELLTDWSDKGQVILADTVDWSEITPEEFSRENLRFRIRQKAGDGSALGKVKFSLTNPFQVYLHDTPAREFFNRKGRALSHGCVRVEKPLDLAEWLLRPAWTREKMAVEIRKGEASILPVAGKGVPVHILYWTVFADPQGGLQWRRDIYGWDRKLKAPPRMRTAGL